MHWFIALQTQTRCKLDYSLAPSGRRSSAETRQISLNCKTSDTHCENLAFTFSHDTAWSRGDISFRQIEHKNPTLRCAEATTIPDQSRPEPTSADQATTRPSNGARSTAIYHGTASPAPTPDQSRPDPTKADQATTRPSNGARSTAIYNGTASPAPTPDQSRPSNHQTSNGARSTAIYNGTTSPAPTPDQSRPEPTKQPPDPLTEPDLLRFTMGQRRRRPHPNRADQSRPSNHQTL